MDLLEHVNNATYADFAVDAATQALAALGWSPSQFKTEGFSVVNRRFQIQYQSPALWGDTLKVAAYLVELKPTGGTWYIEVERVSDSKSIVKCVIEWSSADRVSGEEQTLPESLFRVLKKTVIFAEKDDLNKSPHVEVGTSVQPP